MNESDLSSLTYKELQALAVQYGVPGNIKKHQLVRVLRAAQSGNTTEVEQILAELQQTRKKRIKKIKRDKMNVMSTPIHSPTYAMSEDYYYPQQHPPYQWVGAEEEISSREEDPARFPDYEEFHDIFLRRIQRQYRSYAIPGNELPIPSVVDLRMGAGSSIVRQVPTELSHLRANAATDLNGYEQPLHSDDTNVNNQIPILLKKMLEAPAGTNLERLASTDKESYQISSINDPMNDSDTLTAESDGDNDDLWEKNNPENENRYCFVIDNAKEPLSINQSLMQDKSLQDIGQLPNNFLTNNANEYQNSVPNADVQANCQKWIATNSFPNRIANYAENFGDTSRGYGGVYHENSCANGRTTKSRDREQNYQSNGQNGNINYEANDSSLNGQAVNESYQYYHLNNETTDAYCAQQMAKRVGDLTQKYFAQSSCNNLHANVNYDVQAAQGSPAEQLSGNGVLFNPQESNNLQYNAGYYTQYTNDNNQSLAGYQNAQNQQQQCQYQQQEQQQHQYQPLQQFQQQSQHHQYQQQTNVATAQEIVNRKNFEQPTTSQSGASVPLDSFFPRWPINSTITSSGQLGTIWNLHNYNYVDYTKLDQTSCVYCYTEPMVTQRIGSMNTALTQKNRRRAECRQHSFRPNRLVYNDASTGLRLSNASELLVPKTCSQELLMDVPSTSSMDLDSENMDHGIDGTTGSTESSDNSINDVWIHDYTRYPASCEYTPQSNSIIIDENDNDLFSL